MKYIKKHLGVWGFILLISFGMVACSNEEPLPEEPETGSPEGVTIAYLQGFREGDYTQLETMVEEMPKVGDIYFTLDQQPPKTLNEMIRSQYEFIVHFYGEDAWDRVDYQIPKKASGDVQVDLFFSEEPVHLMGYQNIHIILSDESGAWQIKKGLSWEQDIYGEAPKPDYYQGEEAIYRGIDGTMNPEQVREILGEPIHREENKDYGYQTLSMDYQDASYYFIGGINDSGEFDKYYLESIVVMGGEERLPRDIQMGDTFDQIMRKFPRDKDWTADPNNCFYGENTLEGFGGACFSYEDDAENVYDTIVLVPVEYTPYYKLEFTNGQLMTAMLVFIQIQ
ncbi:MAG: hypothetical protein EOM59_12505 [Clostridia bacterium]|jgi:hypothetical protein|nr:hypothetical protein [Clostridia bacterium]